MEYIRKLERCYKKHIIKILLLSGIFTLGFVIAVFIMQKKYNYYLIYPSMHIISLLMGITCLCIILSILTRNFSKSRLGAKIFQGLILSFVIVLDLFGLLLAGLNSANEIAFFNSPTSDNCLVVIKSSLLETTELIAAPVEYSLFYDKGRADKVFYENFNDYLQMSVCWKTDQEVFVQLSSKSLFKKKGVVESCTVLFSDENNE